MTRRPQLRRLATATATAAALAMILAACGSSQTADPQSTSAATVSAAAEGGSAAPGTADGGVDLSGVTLRVGETGFKQQELLLENAGLADTPYKIEYSLFQGGNLQLEALGAGAIDLASTSEIPPIFAAQSGGPGSLNIIAVRQGTTLQQEVVVPQGSAITDVAGLKGKKVAYVQNTTAHYFLYKALEAAGLAWTDIDAVPLSTSDGLAALLANQVDALASYGNAIISAHANGATTLVDAKDILSGQLRLRLDPDDHREPGDQGRDRRLLLPRAEGLQLGAGEPGRMGGRRRRPDQAAGRAGQEDLRRRRSAAAQQVRPHLARGDRLHAGRPGHLRQGRDHQDHASTSHRSGPRTSTRT